MAKSRLCSIPGCGKPVKAHGWCRSHYERWRRNGDPRGGRTAPGGPERYFLDVVLAYDGDECLPWPYATTSGYGTLKYEGRMQLVSRLVCQEVNGPPPTPEHEAAHSCGKGHEACCTKRHLSWKTGAENGGDKLGHGTHNRGERHNLVKLTEAEVREIRSLKGSMSQHKIAKKFGVHAMTVNRIHLGKRWSWLD